MRWEKPGDGTFITEICGKELTLRMPKIGTSDGYLQVNLNSKSFLFLANLERDSHDRFHL